MGPVGKFIILSNRLALIAAVVLVGKPAAAAEFIEKAPIIVEKFQATEALEAEARQRSSYGPYVSRATRNPTERDSGHDEALLFMNNVNFRLFGSIGFLAEKLVVAARANDPRQPIVIDDPKSFGLTVLNGRLLVSTTSLTELLNTHVFNFEGAPLRGIKVSATPGRLIIAGEVNRRGKWINLTMEGTIALANSTTLAFNPVEISIEGKSIAELLTIANVDLDELLTLKATGVELVKSTLYLRPDLLFPPPALAIALKAVSVDERGLFLEAASAHNPSFPGLIEQRESYILIKGGDVKFFNVMPTNILMEIVSLKSASRLDFSLYDYRSQIAGGFLKFRPNGAIVAHLKDYSELQAGEKLQ